MGQVRRATGISVHRAARFKKGTAPPAVPVKLFHRPQVGSAPKKKRAGSKRTWPRSALRSSPRRSSVLETRDPR